jgi:uncharacterized membrane protein YccC
MTPSRGRLAKLFDQYRSELGFALRITVASLASYAVAHALSLHLPLWAVLTSVIVTQVSVGRSLKMTADYLIGTLGGAIYGGAIAVFIPHTSEWALLAVLALVVMPMALIAAIRPGLNAAPVTAIIVLLVPLMSHIDPLDSAIDRVLEVAVGALIGLAVSLLVVPSRGHSLATTEASRALDLMAVAFEELLAGVTGGTDIDAMNRLQDGIGQSLATLNALAQEAERERRVRVAMGPDTGPMLRTLLRLRHDMVMIGRATGSPLPAPILLHMGPVLTQAREVTSSYLRACSVALATRTTAPSRDAIRAARHRYAAAFEDARNTGLTRDLPGDVAERFFALGFAFDQMNGNLRDLERVVGEWAKTDPLAAPTIRKA